LLIPLKKSHFIEIHHWMLDDVLDLHTMWRLKDAQNRLFAVESLLSFWGVLTSLSVVMQGITVSK
jgi:hypothetical protein